MSIELQSPYSSLRSKRFLEDDDQQGRHPLAELGSKRLRQQASPGRCVPGGQAYAVGHSTVAALRALFPQMNDKVRGRRRGVAAGAYGGGRRARYRVHGGATGLAAASNAFQDQQLLALGIKERGRVAVLHWSRSLSGWP